MRFYALTANYVGYLQGFDPRVPNHSGPGYVQRKPYVGVVLNIEGHEFLAPMTSPKEWHEGLKASDPKYFKMHHVSDETHALGMISLRHMIPVIAGAYQQIDFTQCDPKYVTLLQAQFDFIKPRRDLIRQKSEKVFDGVVNKKQKFMIDKCCDFPTLLANYKNYDPK